MWKNNNILCAGYTVQGHISDASRNGILWGIFYKQQILKW